MNHLTSDTLIDFLHGELSAADDAIVHAHLAACQECRHAHDAEAALTEVLRAAAATEEREMPSLVKARVWERVRTASPGPMARLAALLRPAIAIPAALVLLVGGWFASPLSHSGASPTVDANYYLQAHAADTGETPLSERSGPPALETSMADRTWAAPALDAYASYAATGAFDAVR